MSPDLDGGPVPDDQVKPGETYRVSDEGREPEPVVRVVAEHPKHPGIPPTMDPNGVDCLVCDLVNERESFRQRMLATEKDRDAWRDARRVDDEADAIDGCVRVLEQFRKRTNPTAHSATITMMPMTQAASFERVLHYLADRFGVTWYTPPGTPTEGAPE